MPERQDVPAGRRFVGGRPPRKRWYDARQRCAIRLLASWLKVPWKMVVNFECLLVYRLLLPPEEASTVHLTPWDHGIRAAKIGAASLGIGAIFAVTGLVGFPFSCRPKACLKLGQCSEILTGWGILNICLIEIKIWRAWHVLSKNKLATALGLSHCCQSECWSEGNSGPCLLQIGILGYWRVGKLCRGSGCSSNCRRGWRCHWPGWWLNSCCDRSDRSFHWR